MLIQQEVKGDTVITLRNKLWPWLCEGCLALFSRRLAALRRSVQLFAFKYKLIDDSLYSSILRSLEQTHCARMWFFMSD